MRPVGVVMADVLPQDPFEMPLSESKELVQAVAPHRAHPPLGKGIGTRRADRCARHADTLPGEHGIEGWRDVLATCGIRQRLDGSVDGQPSGYPTIRVV